MRKLNYNKAIKIVKQYKSRCHRKKLKSQTNIAKT